MKYRIPHKYLPPRSAGDIVRFKKGLRGHPSTAKQITIQDTTEKSADIYKKKKKILPRRRGVKKRITSVSVYLNER